jgi:hypothetical protein
MDELVPEGRRGDSNGYAKELKLRTVGVDTVTCLGRQASGADASP